MLAHILCQNFYISIEFTLSLLSLLVVLDSLWKAMFGQTDKAYNSQSEQASSLFCFVVFEILNHELKKFHVNCHFLANTDVFFARYWRIKKQFLSWCSIRCSRAD